MNPLIKAHLSTLPFGPGVYLMKNKQGKIIYIGKAKNLNNRVSQYFERPQTGKVLAMVRATEDLEIILTNNEKEALILEMNLIHKHYPRYNIMLKEGSHYPYIALHLGKVPYLSIARRKESKNFAYFGPYPNSRSAYRMIDLLNKIFPLRRSGVQSSLNNLYYEFSLEIEGSKGELTGNEVRNLKDEISSFLDGKVEERRKLFLKLMLDASERQNYELAQDYKIILQDIDNIAKEQNVELKTYKDYDVISFVQKNGYVAIVIMSLRQGKILGTNRFVVEQFDEFNEQISSLLGQYYLTHSKPNNIVFLETEIAEIIRDSLGVKVTSPSRGKLYDIALMARQNALQTINEHFISFKAENSHEKLLHELATLLNIEAPIHIEMFDNSHLQGDASVGAMVVFINGEPVKKMYRKFKIEGEDQGDDIGSMRQIIYRRYKRLVDENLDLPNMIIVDGSVHQVAAAQESLHRLNLNIPLFGLYKNDKHQTRGIVDVYGITYDLSANPPLFFFLTRIQDEVHRFAITFHRKIRSKNVYKSWYDDVPGLGKVRINSLKKAYPNFELLMQATIDDLSQWVPLEVANKLYAKIHGGNIDIVDVKI